MNCLLMTATAGQLLRQRLEQAKLKAAEEERQKAEESLDQQAARGAIWLIGGELDGECCKTVNSGS